MFLTPGEAVLTLRVAVEPEARSEQPVARSGLKDLKSSPPFQTATVHLQLMGADPKPQVTGLEKLVAKANYFVGSDPKDWHTGIPTFAKVRYADVYPGVDLIYYGNQGKLEYDFVVAPGADPKVIKLRFEGLHSPPQINSEGHLVLVSEGGDLRLQKPLIYQEIGDRRHTIDGRYSLRQDNSVGFELGAYDPSKTLIIDPILIYSTYLGGSGEEGRGGTTGIAVDANGNAYVAGETPSSDFPTANPFQPLPSGPDDAFVTKFDPTGALVYSTYLGGSEGDDAQGIALDDTGNVYVTGTTGSDDFPFTNVLHPSCSSGGAFVAKFNPEGSMLVYSTCLANNATPWGGIAVDTAGSAYVTGSTCATDFPVVNAFQPVKGPNTRICNNAFVTKFDPTGSALVYSTYLGGNGRSLGLGIAVDSAGSAYVTGENLANDFPFTNTLHPSCSFGGAFVTKFNPEGSTLAYSACLGDDAVGRGIAVDAAGSAYVTREAGLDFPTTSDAVQPMPSAGGDAFVTKLDPTGSALVYSTYLGGHISVRVNNDEGLGIAVDAVGNAYVTGRTDSTDFHVINALQPVFGGGDWDAFVTKLDPTGSTLSYSTFLGGNARDLAVGIAVDAVGNANVTGRTNSTDFPTVSAAQPNLGGFRDAFVAKIFDGRAPIGVFRNGGWTLDFNGNGQFDDCTTDRCISFGLTGDFPVTGDWDGSGTTKIGVFRAGGWSLDFNGNGQWDGCEIDQCISYGLAGDRPVTGDWDGSGITKIGVVRSGRWTLDFNGNGQFDNCTTDQCINFGQAIDFPVTGDWDGSGTTKIVVFANGNWLLDLNGNGQQDGCTIDQCAVYSSAGHNPVTGDWSGSGTAKIGALEDFRWVLDFDGDGQFDECTADQCITFGLPGHLPVTGRW